MLIATLLILALLALGLGAFSVHRLGDGDGRRGRLAAIRRIRRVRRRAIHPRLMALRRTAGLAWARPLTRPLVEQIRQLGTRLDGARWHGDRYERAQRSLESVVATLNEMGPISWTESQPAAPSYRVSKQAPERSWVVGLLLGVSGLVIAGGNAWALYTYVVPELQGTTWLPATAVTSALPAGGFAALPLLLGAAYFALLTAGRHMGLRVLAAIAVLAVAAQAALEAGAVVLVLQLTGLATLDWWGGIASAILIGGAAALVPPLTASLVHAAFEDVRAWAAARQRRAARRELARGDRVANEIRDSMMQLGNSMEGLRAEVVAIGSEPAGRLLLQPSEKTSVDRLRLVLARLADSLESGRLQALGRDVRPAAVAGRLLGDMGMLIAWLATAGAGLAVLATALETGATTGSPFLFTAGAMAAFGVLATAGLTLRLLLARSSAQPGSAARALAVLLVGLGSASLALSVGPLAAGMEFFEGRPLAAAAWLNILTLVAAVTATRLPEGITAVASFATFALTGAGLAALWLVDTSMAAVDAVLSGRRPRRRGPRPTGRTGATSRSTPAASTASLGERVTAR